MHLNLEFGVFTSTSDLSTSRNAESFHLMCCQLVLTAYSAGLKNLRPHLGVE